MYKLILKADGGLALDERDVSTDDEMAKALGMFSLWYFLALDSADYSDAYGHMSPANCPADALLAFTCDKATDEPDGPHRHGLPKGKLAYGHAWVNGAKKSVSLYVERQ